MLECENMNKRRKIVAGAAVAITLIVLFSIISSFNLCVKSKIDFGKEDALFYLKRDKEDVTTITSYLKNLEYTWVTISFSSDYVTVDDGVIKKESISDESVKTAISNLIIEKGYVRINKNRNTIEFNMYSGFSDVSKGIAYSIDGTSTPNIDYLTRLEEIEDSWFYYETKYE